MDPARRQLLGNASHVALLAVAGVLWGLGFSTERRRPPELVRVEVPISGLPPAFDGFTIAQLTDLHLGASLLRREHVQAMVELVNAQRPDVVALTGDLGDGFAHELAEETAPLAELRAPHGRFSVSGNHEYYWDPAGWHARVAALGFTVLVNEHRVVERDGARLVIAGGPDPTAASVVGEHVSEPATALRGAPEGATRVLLAHQPTSARAAQEAGFHLQLSGHTHGGQFWPWTWAIRLATRYVVGLYRVKDLWLYVSRGTGTWGPPLRLGMPAELTLVTLRRASPQA